MACGQRDVAGAQRGLAGGQRRQRVGSGGIYRIGSVSRWSGLSPATLRLWEEQYGLLHPERSAGGMRLYSDADVERILYIRQLVREGGYTLEAIARILDESRLGLPQLMEDLAEAEHSGSKALQEIAAELRGLVEDVHLKDITSREREREGGVLWGISSLVRRLVSADSFMKAGSTLVVGAQELTGAQSASLGVYEPKEDTLTYVLTARAGQLQQPTYKGWPLKDMPSAWRRALREGRPYYARRFRIEEVPAEAQGRVRASGVKSFYSHPLRVGSELVGTLVITSPKVDGITPEMQATCQHLAAPAAAAIAYFASRAPAASAPPP